MKFLASSASSNNRMLPLLVAGTAAAAGVCAFIKKRNDSHDIPHR
jgi:hypothetical protein